MLWILATFLGKVEVDVIFTGVQSFNLVKCKSSFITRWKCCQILSFLLGRLKMVIWLIVSETWNTGYAYSNKLRIFSK